MQGSLHLLEALKPLQHPCAVVMVTTDKVYVNPEWDFGYREVDRLGGHDPYSASKAISVTRVSRSTAWRYLAELVVQKAIEPIGEGRSRAYRLQWPGGPLQVDDR